VAHVVGIAIDAQAGGVVLVLGAHGSEDHVELGGLYVHAPHAISSARSWLLGPPRRGIGRQACALGVSRPVAGTGAGAELFALDFSEVASSLIL
jgi:hypothetical protein